MAGTQRLKAWFFGITSSVRLDGTVGGTRFRNTDKPPQPTFEDLLESTAFKTESGDRAKVYTGATLGSEQGLSVLANDTQAKANTAQLPDRSLVTQPHQLPTIENVDTSAVEDMPVTTTTVDTGAATTRNQFRITLASTWIGWLISRIFKQGGVEGDVPIKNSGTDYDWTYGNVGNNTTTVNAIAGNSTFISTLTNNATFATALQTTITTILTSNPTYITDSLDVGFMRMYPSVTVPAKWLRMDGALISKTTYSELFTLFGANAFGIDTGTDFYLPDFTDRQATGYGTNPIGNADGDDTHLIGVGNLPPHTHGAGSLVADAVGDHTHTSSNVTTVSDFQRAGVAIGALEQAAPNTGPSGAHGHTISGSTDNGLPALTGTALDTRDKYLTVNFIIKVLP